MSLENKWNKQLVLSRIWERIFINKAIEVEDFCKKKQLPKQKEVVEDAKGAVEGAVERS